MEKNKIEQKDFEKNINKWHKNSNEDKIIGWENGLHRNSSWIFCYENFGNLIQRKEISDDNIDNMALHLSMYLASWGMYRGGSVLLKYFSYKIHIEIVKVLIKDKYKVLYGINDFKTIEENIELIYDLYNEIDKKYKDLFNNINMIHHDNNESKTKMKKEATTTLITKVMLGTYGCFVALDEYVNNTLNKKFDIKGKIFRKNKNESLAKMKEILELFDGIESINKTQNSTKQSNSIELVYKSIPIMKQIDMFLWAKSIGIRNKK